MIQMSTATVENIQRTYYTFLVTRQIKSTLFVVVNYCWSMKNNSAAFLLHPYGKLLTVT